MSYTPTPVPAGYVQLWVNPPRAPLPTVNPGVRLHIPLQVISPLCLKLRKYLAFLGWCILGVDGFLSDSHTGQSIELDGDLTEGGEYFYFPNEATNLHPAVDLEVAKMRSTFTSGITESRNHFREELEQRDEYCVFTGVSRNLKDAMHIIPHARGSEWLQIIIANRLTNQEDMSDLSEINDIRNGVLVSKPIHAKFDAREIAILKTPNHFLTTSDIPPPTERPLYHANVGYLEDERYTLHWLIDHEPSDRAFVALNNVDAAFVKDKDLPKPSALLLHYIYGAAALTQWGQDTTDFVKRLNIPRPKKEVLATHAPKIYHDRTATIQKRSGAGPVDEGGGRNQSDGGGPVDEGGGRNQSDGGGPVDEGGSSNESDGGGPVDEGGSSNESDGGGSVIAVCIPTAYIPEAEIVVAQNWADAPAARERRFQEAKEKVRFVEGKERFVERWRQGVMPVSQ